MFFRTPRPIQAISPSLASLAESTRGCVHNCPLLILTIPRLTQVMVTSDHSICSLPMVLSPPSSWRGLYKIINQVTHKIAHGKSKTPISLGLESKLFNLDGKAPQDLPPACSPAHLTPPSLFPQAPYFGLFPEQPILDASRPFPLPAMLFLQVPTWLLWSLRGQVKCHLPRGPSGARHLHHFILFSFHVQRLSFYFSLPL